MFGFQQTKITKFLVIFCVVSFLAQQFGQTFGHLDVVGMLGFVPDLFWTGYVWQAFTYLFLHDGLFHLLFNMLALAMMGPELEFKWGKKFFGIYFGACAVGAILIYGSLMPFLAPVGLVPVVGASAGIYGLLLAYGVLFGERQMLFMFIFPMRAKYFCLVLGAIEMFMLIFERGRGSAALAHLGGILVGYIVLWIETKRRMNNRNGNKGGGWGGFGRRKKAHLRVVVDNRERRFH